MTNAISLKIRGQALRLGAMLFTLTALATSTVQAGYVAGSDGYSLPANDLIEWSVLGPAFTAMPNPFVVESTGDTNVTCSQINRKPERRDNGNTVVRITEGKFCGQKNVFTSGQVSGLLKFSQLSGFQHRAVIPGVVMRFLLREQCFDRAADQLACGAAQQLAHVRGNR